MDFGFGQFPLSSPVGYFADDFLCKELCPLQQNILGFPLCHSCFSLQRGHADNDNLEPRPELTSSGFLGLF